MKKTGGYYFLGFLIVLMLFVIFSAVTWIKLEAKIMPIAAAGVVLVCACAQLFKEINANRKVAVLPERAELGAVPGRKNLRRFSIIMSWIVGLAVGLYVLGFTIAMPVFCFAYLKTSRRGWLTSAVYSILVSASVYAAFRLGLRMSFYNGIIDFSLPY